MRPQFNIKTSVTTLAVAIASLSIAGVASAAGMDRSGQDITAFLQDGLYAEAVYTYIDADVTGHDNTILGVSDLDAYDRGRSTGDIAEAYDFFRMGVKADINDTFSVGILYDEPFGASAEYNGDSNFVSGNGDSVIQGLLPPELGITNVAELNSAMAQTVAGAQQYGAMAQRLAQQAASAAAAGDTAEATRLSGEAQQAGAKAQELVAQATALATPVAIANAENDAIGEGTKVEVRTENLTGILGMKFGDNFQVYGGPVIQRLHADVALRGSAYLPSTGYTAHISPTDGYGWLAGVAYSRPEIALKAALTYRSEIDHEESNVDESLPGADYLPATVQAQINSVARANGEGSMEITTPESFNFDFQTGINPTTLATAKVRYVPWEDFAIVPPRYNAGTTTVAPNGLPLVDYSDDQWQVELGLARRINPALAVSGTVGWDSGAGDPTTSLGPIEGYYSVGAGAKFNITPNWAISAGAKYLMFGDAEGSLPNGKVVSRFEDNDGYVAGIKLSYQEL